MTVRDLMHRSLVTCSDDLLLGPAAALLLANRVHALVVVGPDNKPIGIFSDTDLLAGEWLSIDDPSFQVMREMTVGELMTAPPTTIEAGTSLEEAAARMRRDHISRMLVSDGGSAVGIIAVSDLVAQFGSATGEGRNVADVMSRGVVVCLPDSPVVAVARAMHERRSRSVLVVSSRGVPLGIVTGIDVLALYDHGENVGATASEIMHPPLTIHPEATLREAADMMLEHEIHRLLVVDPGDPDGMPLGLISTSDIVAEMAAPTSIWNT